ncbi:MAG: hypothetical protein HY561_13870 [Gemmatimonadetes bacterium]|nr:hypothetical protein [Gemmatimonadota bacterium]
MMRSTVFGMLLLGLVARDAFSQAMPFHTPTAMPLPLAEHALRAFYQRIELGSLLRDGDEIGNPEGARVSVDALPLAAPYGLTGKTTLFLGIPYLRKTFEERAGERRNSGLGDAFVLIKQELLQRDFLAGNRRLALFAGGTLPTGETGDAADPLPPALRLGAGTVTLTGFAVYSHVDDRVGVHGRLGYSGALGDRFGVRPGGRLLYDVGFGYRLLPHAYASMRDATLSAYLELNGALEGRATRDSARLPDTGGHTLFVSPGIQFIPLPNWALEASLQLPVVRELNGTQLAPDWSLAVGARTVFYLFGH